MHIVERNLGRAGNKEKREEQQNTWNSKYGKHNWVTGYEVAGKFIPYKRAISKIYDASYFKFLDDNPDVRQAVIAACGVFNPHALFTGNMDIQAKTIERYMKSRGFEFQGKDWLPIGTFRPHRITLHTLSKATKKGLKISNGYIKYPEVSKKLSPFNVPCIVDEAQSVEYFWQSDAKCLAIVKRK